jgi:hypothetical protein
MIYLEQTGIYATLTTWIYTSFWQLYAAHQTGRKAYIHWPNQPDRRLHAYADAAQYGRQPNMFDWYFVQPDTSEVPPCDEVWTWEDNPPVVGQHSLMSQPLQVIRAFYQQHLRFSAAVEARGAALQAKYGINFADTIGVTWRGTDIYLDGRPRLPIELYFPFIDKLLREQAGMRVCCTAEEEGVLGPLLSRYPSAFVVEEFLAAPAGAKENPERHSPVSGFERGMQPALMVWLFSKCAAYVKNRSSTGAVASWLSRGKVSCLGHNENLDYGKPPILHPDTGAQLWPQA